MLWSHSPGLTCPGSFPSAWTDCWGECWDPQLLRHYPVGKSHLWTLKGLCLIRGQENLVKKASFEHSQITLKYGAHLSRVQLTDALLSSLRYPVAKPMRRPSWSLTTMRSPLVRPQWVTPCCGAALLRRKRWRKTPSDWAVTEPLSCTFPTQLPFFSLCRNKAETCSVKYINVKCEKIRAEYYQAALVALWSIL